MFFQSCKFAINSRDDYIKFTNHYSDVLRGDGELVGSIRQFPIYVFVERNDSLSLTWSYETYEYDRRPNTHITLDVFLTYRYIITYHFERRFNERFEKASFTRMKKLLKGMIQSGKHMKRKDSFQLMKYKKPSNYILYSRYEVSDKAYYLIVISNINILTTIYKFEDLKDLKYFKEI